LIYRIPTKRREVTFKVEFSTVINRPVAEVFAFITDPSNNTKYQEGLIESRLETPGPIGVGSKATDVRKFLGRQLELKLEVTAYEPGKRFGLKAVSGPIPFEVLQTFEPVEGGTRIELITQAEPGGFFKLAEGMVKKQLESQLSGDMARLKKVLEG